MWFHPNSAISADKMNVVYRGCESISISFAGIADKDVNASARFDKLEMENLV
jgi:hypothetical protein